MDFDFLFQLYLYNLQLVVYKERCFQHMIGHIPPNTSTLELKQVAQEIIVET